MTDKNNIKDSDINNLDNNDIVRMILNSQQSSSSKKSININPTLAVIALIGIIVVLVQVMIGVGMWSIQDRLDRYDAYDERIVNLENAVVRFESTADVIDNLVEEFRQYSSKPTFSKKEFDNRFNDKILPLRNQLNRIEDLLDKDTKSIENEVEELDDKIDKLDRRLHMCERELDFRNRRRNSP